MFLIKDTVQAKYVAFLGHSCFWYLTLILFLSQLLAFSCFFIFDLRARKKMFIVYVLPQNDQQIRVFRPIKVILMTIMTSYSNFNGNENF